MSTRSAPGRRLPGRWWVILVWLAAGCAQRAAAPHEWRRSPAFVDPGAPPLRSVHVVKSGETLSAIAALHRLPIKKIAELNGLQDPNQLRVGQRLRLTAVGVGDHAQSSAHAPEPSAREVKPRREAKRAEDPKVDCHAHGPAPRGWSSSREGFAWPVDGLVVTKFGKLEGRKHEGLAIGAPKGTPVWASAEGRVILIGKQQGYGQLVVLSHEKGLVTVYGSLDRPCVKSGDKVRRGALLGLVGDSSGVASPRLYFELRDGETRLNPWPRLP